MRIERTHIEGVAVLHPRVFEDERGFFFESYNEGTMRGLGIESAWVQDNHARSQRGTLRGLHFQAGKGQAKLARCIAGKVWDVAVDIRLGSPTLGLWFGAELSAENKKIMMIPGGFAHGYCVLSEQAEVLYKCSTIYDPALESEIAWNDPDLNIDWPVQEPILSKRDIEAKSFAEYLNAMRTGGKQA